MEIDADGCVIVTVKLEVQLLASVTVTVYTPAIKLLRLGDVAPPFHK